MTAHIGSSPSTPRGTQSNPILPTRSKVLAVNIDTLERTDSKPTQRLAVTFATLDKPGSKTIHTTQLTAPHLDPSLPADLQHPEFFCPRTQKLLTRAVWAANGRSYQEAEVDKDGAPIAGTGVDRKTLPQPVMDDRATRKFVAAKLDLHRAEKVFAEAKKEFEKSGQNPEAAEQVFDKAKQAFEKAKQACHEAVEDAFACPILLDGNPSSDPVVWVGEGLTEWHLYDRQCAKDIFANDKAKSPLHNEKFPEEVTLLSHLVARAYAARVVYANDTTEPKPLNVHEEKLTRSEAGSNRGRAPVIFPPIPRVRLTEPTRPTTGSHLRMAGITTGGGTLAATAIGLVAFGIEINTGMPAMSALPAVWGAASGGGGLGALIGCCCWMHRDDEYQTALGRVRANNDEYDAQVQAGIIQPQGEGTPANEQQPAGDVALTTQHAPVQQRLQHADSSDEYDT